MGWKGKVSGERGKGRGVRRADVPRCAVGTPDSSVGTGKVRAKSSGKHIVKDLATITLHEPHIDDYLLQDVDMRIDDGLGDQPLFGENEPVGHALAAGD